MLLSQAMAEGLFHPRCRHGLGTYYPELEDIVHYETEDNKLNEYGTEELNQAHVENMIQKYKRLTVGSIKFIKKNDGNVTAPLETMTKGRVYVTLNNDNKPKFISYYDASNKMSKTIDLDKPHNGISPHVHHGYEHNEGDNSKGATGLTVKERKMVDNVKKIWYNKINK